MKQEKKVVTEKELIDAIDAYKVWLFNNKAISPTKFNCMQAALLGAKNLIRDKFGSKRQGEEAWIK